MPLCSSPTAMRSRAAATAMAAVSLSRIARWYSSCAFDIAFVAWSIRLWASASILASTAGVIAGSSMSCGYNCFRGIPIMQPDMPESPLAQSEGWAPGVVGSSP